MCVPCKRKCPQRQKEDVNALELKLLTVVCNLIWMLGTKLGSTAKTTVFNFWAISSVSQPWFLTYFIDVYFTHYKKLPVFWLNRMVQLLVLRHFCISHAHRQLLLLCVTINLFHVGWVLILCACCSSCAWTFSFHSEMIVFWSWYGMLCHSFILLAMYYSPVRMIYSANGFQTTLHRALTSWKKVDVFPHQLTNASVPCD